MEEVSPTMRVPFRKLLMVVTSLQDNLIPVMEMFHKSWSQRLLDREAG
jgi:hypothetical protein